MRELWLMIRHPWNVRRYLRLESLYHGDVALTYAARAELHSLRNWLVDAGSVPALTLLRAPNGESDA